MSPAQLQSPSSSADANTPSLLYHTSLKRIFFKAFAVSLVVALLVLLFAAEQTTGLIPYSSNQTQQFTVSTHAAPASSDSSADASP